MLRLLRVDAARGAACTNKLPASVAAAQMHPWRLHGVAPAVTPQQALARAFTATTQVLARARAVRVREPREAGAVLADAREELVAAQVAASHDAVAVPPSPPEQEAAPQPAAPAAPISVKSRPDAGKPGLLLRLNAALARAGLGSRRGCEELITGGRVRVNGSVVRELAAKVDIKRDELLVDNKPLSFPKTADVFVLHKLRGEIVSHADPQGRPSVFERVKTMGLPTGLISVGRLDFNSEGVLVLTNDRALARYLEHPSSRVPRVYRAKVYGKGLDNAIKALSRGARIGGMQYGQAAVRVLAETETEFVKGEGEEGGSGGSVEEDRGFGVGDTKVNAWIEITLFEGKNREIRNILEHFGLSVNRLIRVRYGPFRLTGLARGYARAVDVPDELARAVRKYAATGLKNEPVPLQYDPVTGKVLGSKAGSGEAGSGNSAAAAAETDEAAAAAPTRPAVSTAAPWRRPRKVAPVWVPASRAGFGEESDADKAEAPTPAAAASRGRRDADRAPSRDRDDRSSSSRRRAGSADSGYKPSPRGGALRPGNEADRGVRRGRDEGTPFRERQPFGGGGNGGARFDRGRREERSERGSGDNSSQQRWEERSGSSPRSRSRPTPRWAEGAAEPPVTPKGDGVAARLMSPKRAAAVTERAEAKREAAAARERGGSVSRHSGVRRAERSAGGGAGAAVAVEI